MSRDSLAAARRLRAAGHWRSAISRCYYAAYAALTHELVLQGTLFPRGWKNPPHDHLPRLVHGLGRLPVETRRDLAKAIRILLAHRIDADYFPGRVSDRRLTVDCLHHTLRVMKRLGVILDES